MGLSYIQSSDGLGTTSLSQGCFLEMVPNVVTVGRVYIPRTGEWVRSPLIVHVHSQVSWCSCLLNDLLQHNLHVSLLGFM